MKQTIALILTVYFSVTSAQAQDGPEFFEKNIRPLFARQCMACHSATAGMGGLKLDTRENLLKGGKRGPAVTPGKSDESILLRAVTHSAGLKMPPSGKLKDSEIAGIDPQAFFAETVRRLPLAEAVFHVLGYALSEEFL